MAANTCDQCGATVAADEQFCPNCGAFIDPLRHHTERRRDNVISIGSDGPYEEFRLGSPPPPRPRPLPAGNGSELICPSCGAVNPSNNRHCQECGARLSQAPLPTAPRPTVQATAGVRAALAISALLFGVVVVALLFNIINGGAEAGDTTTTVASTTSTTVAEIGPIEVINTECIPDESVGSFVCENLTSGTEAEYQIVWEDLDPQELTLRFTFRQPMVVQRIDWANLTDDVRFRRNYRARGLIIQAEDSLQPLPFELEDEPGTQTIAFTALNTNSLDITVTSAYQAQVVDENVFRELAIQEITIYGRPATTPNTTVPGGTTETTGTTTP